MVFVVIDGLDGSGKSTQARLLCEKVADKGLSFIVRTHPSGDNWFGQMGRGYLLMEGRRARIAASLFYILDVFRSLILYGWRRCDYLVFVRYLMGTAYLPRPLDRFAYLFFLRSLPTSEHMYFIDVSPDEAHQRIEANRSQKEMFESREKLVEVRGNVLRLIRNGEWTVVDGDKPTLIIHDELMRSLAL
ncbi:MAG: thymidylate kinase [Candidatus Bathyarchaeota archaeon]|nr:thymidylate kinase [Candidatus Bathyarchaeota archaeon]